MEFHKYDEDELKLLKELELMILKDYIAICEENNLEYYMYGGSLLGAIRHQGFIPWDDDIDIIMPPEDYNRFIEIMEKSDDKYSILTMDNQDDFYLLFTKMMLNGTKFEEWWHEQVDFESGICIDIFPFNNVPENKIKRFFLLKRGRLIRTLLISNVLDLNKSTKLRKTIGKCLRLILGFFRISTRNLKDKVKALLNKYNDKDCKLVCDISGLNRPEVYYKDDFFPPIKAKFEDIEVNIPNNYDRILTTIYGDYMQLPPEEDRYNHAPEKLDFGSYKKY